MLIMIFGEVKSTFFPYLAGSIISFRDWLIPPSNFSSLFPYHLYLLKISFGLTCSAYLKIWVARLLELKTLFSYLEDGNWRWKGCYLCRALIRYHPLTHLMFYYLVESLEGWMTGWNMECQGVSWNALAGCINIKLTMPWISHNCCHPHLPHWSADSALCRSSWSWSHQWDRFGRVTYMFVLWRQT